MFFSAYFLPLDQENEQDSDDLQSKRRQYVQLVMKNATRDQLEPLEKDIERFEAGSLPHGSSLHRRDLVALFEGQAPGPRGYTRLVRCVGCRSQQGVRLP